MSQFLVSLGGCGRSFSRSFSTCVASCKTTGLMSGSFHAKTLNASSRFVRKMINIEKQKVEKIQREWQQEKNVEKKQKLKDYSIPHKNVIHDTSEKGRGLNGNIIYAFNMISKSEEMRNLLGVEKEKSDRISFTKARIHPSFRVVYVYWSINDPSTTSQDIRSLEEELGPILEELSNDFRHLIEDYCYGHHVVPRIKFIKDSYYQIEVQFKEAFETIRKTTDLSQINPHDLNIQLGNNVLEFNSQRVLQDIQKKIQKSKAEHRRIEESPNNRSTPQDYQKAHDRRLMIKKFIASRYSNNEEKL